MRRTYLYRAVCRFCTVVGVIVDLIVCVRSSASSFSAFLLLIVGWYVACGLWPVILWRHTRTIVPETCLRWIFFWKLCISYLFIFMMMMLVQATDIPTYLLYNLPPIPFIRDGRYIFAVFLRLLPPSIRSAITTTAAHRHRLIIFRYC